MQNCNLPAHTSAKHNPPLDVHAAKASIRLNGNLHVGVKLVRSSLAITFLDVLAHTCLK